MLISLRFAALFFLATAYLGANGEQQNAYCTEDEYYEESDHCERNPSSSCCRKRGHRWGDDPYWRDDRFAKEQFQETGWPGRRGDELSDQLSR